MKHSPALSEHSNECIQVPIDLCKAPNQTSLHRIYSFKNWRTRMRTVFVTNDAVDQNSMLCHLDRLHIMRIAHCLCSNWFDAAVLNAISSACIELHSVGPTYPTSASCSRNSNSCPLLSDCVAMGGWDRDSILESKDFLHL